MPPRCGQGHRIRGGPTRISPVCRGSARSAAEASSDSGSRGGICRNEGAASATRPRDGRSQRDAHTGGRMYGWTHVRVAGARVNARTGGRAARDPARYAAMGGVAPDPPRRPVPQRAPHFSSAPHPIVATPQRGVPVERSVMSVDAPVALRAAGPRPTPTSAPRRGPLVALLAALLALGSLAAAPAPVSAAGIKVAVVVGPAGSLTSSYIRSARGYAAQARSYGATVVRSTPRTPPGHAFAPPSRAPISWSSWATATGSRTPTTRH